MSFLDSIKHTHGDGNYAGDEHGGGAGSEGQGLPTGSPSNFLFATGIECSNPTIENGRVRRDLLEECGHYTHWREDFRLVRDLGLKVLRYHLPIHKVFLGVGRYDWSFADAAMAEIRRLGITPILDLMHFGLPDWLGDFQNPEMPVRFAKYCEAVAQRYPWVRYYTPVNEIYITAKNSGKDGRWNEQLKSDRAFVTALKHCVAASILGTQGIAKHRNDCIIVQSESAEFTHEVKAVPSPEVRLANKQRFISLDLLYAVQPDGETLLYLFDNGLTREEFDWFMRGEPPGYQILGNDYYGRNERILKPDGEMCPAEDVMGWYQITKEYYDRYRKPVMHTETNTFDDQAAASWLWKQWVNVMRMRRDGVPVLGFTWYSLTDQVDWDSQLAYKAGNICTCGLYDLDRKKRPVADAYRQLIQEFGQITILPHAEVFAITDQPARLKVKV